MTGETIPGGSASERGFTLLEVLIALTILGLLVVALTSGVRTGLTLWRAEQQRAAATANLDATARVLRTILTRIPMLATGQPIARLTGGPATFDFIGELPTGFGDRRRAEMSLALDQDQLVLRWKPHLHQRSEAASAPPSEIPLTNGVRRLDIAYYGNPTPNEPPRWVDSWDALYVPELIRIRLVLSPKDNRRWPDLIVAPPL